MVYVLADPTNKSVKVGLTSNLQARLRQYRTHNPTDLQTIATRTFPSASAAARAEAYLLKELKPFHIRGEWHHWPAKNHAVRLLAKAPDKDSIGFRQD